MRLSVIWQTALGLQNRRQIAVGSVVVIFGVTAETFFVEHDGMKVGEDGLGLISADALANSIGQFLKFAIDRRRVHFGHLMHRDGNGAVEQSIGRIDGVYLSRQKLERFGHTTLR